MPEQGVRARQREQTRQTLLRESRRLFSGHGYAAVSLAEIVHAAGVTKGALYHHFTGKPELFRAVLEEVQQEVGRRVAAAADARDDPWEQFTAGCLEFLTAATDPDIQRIMLIDGPAVLGWSEWRAMDEATSARHLTEALASLADAGLIARRPLAPLVHLLSGAMNEAALWLATSPDPADLGRTQETLTQLLGALRAA
ncbi:MULTISPECIES: TetR/AcrR family transcriptional regulator [unclassified Streptomyces]|uniref:TetR/AcrR family transcriptional regulator n=1 Tax=unclassified Streptomyces TaxID=2593676 RepID=UPI001661BD6A|nr:MULTISPECIES: TetR/AcrR family transcriptional regulator [unclassified Streptomyces]MBD0842365.1 TetR/AcrR family transcriptional regulator [Streptomyces sp. TRM68416]